MIEIREGEFIGCKLILTWFWMLKRRVELFLIGNSSGAKLTSDILFQMDVGGWKSNWR